MLYFAYGSNLSIARISKRVPSAEPVARGYLTAHVLCFHKAGRDGSGKCDAFYTGNNRDCVLGSLYRIDADHKVHLDRAEGLGMGYNEKSVSIYAESGQKMEAFTYYATHIDDKVSPYHWYKGHVLIGAREHDFPEEYIEMFLSVDSIDDPDAEREERELSIHGLGLNDGFRAI
ncbi:MAG: gamma-glutamylcyclotransferase [Deltaproteobacteria bacterium]|nr:gamma-glutamylcyclotransferase [Deltaproteobacteria bacterium]